MLTSYGRAELLSVNGSSRSEQGFVVCTRLRTRSKIPEKSGRYRVWIPSGYLPVCFLFCRVGIYPYPPTRLVYLYSGFGYIEKSGVKRGDDVKEPARRASCRVITINSVVCSASECYVVLLKMKTKYMHTYYFTSFLKSLFTAKRIDFSKR